MNALRVMLLAVVIAGGVGTAALEACPLCKESVRSESADLAASYNQSTLLMLGALFGLFGFTAVLFVRSARQK